MKFMRYLEMVMNFRYLVVPAMLTICLGLMACSSPGDPGSEIENPVLKTDLRIAALDHYIGDLTDPEVLARYTRADILIVPCDAFWGKESLEGNLNLLRAAKPELKILGFFRSKVVKSFWGDGPRENQSYNYDLFQASKPYWARTTVGDTVMDWPNAVVYDYTNPAARKAMLDVFSHYQKTSSNKFDGVYWDYFNEVLWIAPAVTSMEGDPDMDGDGVSHWDDPDEIQAFKDAQYDWVHEMQAAMGPDFIQITNGSRALTDSTFAREFDGMFYELFPNVGYGKGETFKRALDPNQYNNLWTALSWPRTSNGGPWLILSHANRVGTYVDPDGLLAPIIAGDLLRAVALLTGATSTHYNNTGLHRSGIPRVELDLGNPLGPATIEGELYSRQFERGSVELYMGAGLYPVPFSYVIPQNGVVVEEFGDFPSFP
jgi:hypothetical protein